MLTSSVPRTSANSRQRVSSAAVRGLRPCPEPVAAGSGSDAVSSFPLAVNGIRSIGTSAAGIM